MAFAEDTAEQLNKDRAKAEFMSEKDTRIYELAKRSASKLGMDVDEACRKLVELQQRLKTDTIEQAVDFHNDHGQRVRHGVANTEIYEGTRMATSLIASNDTGRPEQINVTISP